MRCTAGAATLIAKERCRPLDMIRIQGPGRH
jgi:hypothetical protein